MGNATDEKPAIASDVVAASPTTVQFTTVEELFQHIDNVTGDFLVVQGVSPSDFAAIERERAARRRKFRFRRYESGGRILIITIPTEVHEMLHLNIYVNVSRAIDAMGLEAAWRPTGSATFRRRGHPEGDGGEGDSTGRPKTLQRGSWPTLVIEAGHSESLAELRRDMRWWFGASDHQVKIVLLAKLEEHQGMITIEKWVEVPAEPPRPGATMARAAARLTPTCVQDITITRVPGNPDPLEPSSYEVARGALRLEFERVFLRPAGVGEGDIVIPIPRLQMYAADVWSVV